VCANERTSGVHAARHGPWTGRKGLDRMRYRKFENYCSASRSLSSVALADWFTQRLSAAHSRQSRYGVIYLPGSAVGRSP